MDIREIEAYALAYIEGQLASATDDYERAQAGFIKMSKMEMKEEHGDSGVSRNDIVATYKMVLDTWKEKKISLLKGKAI